jgi:hypothetical protein
MIYGWWRDRFSSKGSSFPYRVKRAVIIVKHNGSTDKVLVDYTDFHKGWKYIGTYDFAAGSDNSIELSNKSNSMGAVVADAFRFIPVTYSVTLSDFFAKAADKQMVITWVTASEKDTTGFNLLRSESVSGEYIRINKTLIPSEGSVNNSSEYKSFDKNIKNH